MNAPAPSPTTPLDPALAATLALYTRLLEAWNRQDADAFAACFAERGASIGFDGSPLDGPAGIAATLREIFAHHPTGLYVSKVREVRALGPGVTLLRAAVGMAPRGQDVLNPVVNAQQSLVCVDGPDGPRIALLQNTPAAFHGRPELVVAQTAELTAVLRSGRVVDAG